MRPDEDGGSGEGFARETQVKAEQSEPYEIEEVHVHVRMGPQCSKKIIVRRDDSPTEVAQLFGKQHGLSWKETEKLAALIKREI